MDCNAQTQQMAVPDLLHERVTRVEINVAANSARLNDHSIKLAMLPAILAKLDILLWVAGGTFLCALGAFLTFLFNKL